MKILVLVKQVISDPSTLDIKPLDIQENVAQNAIDFSQSIAQTSTLDLNAIEQAVLLKEQGIVSHITVCCVGDETMDKSLRTGLAMGADDGVHILADHHNLDILAYTKLLQAYIVQQDFDLVITGREDFDGGAGQSGTMLAALLCWANADSVTSVEKIEQGRCYVGCDNNLGHHDYALRLPAVLSVDETLNEPRFVKFPKLLKARKHPITLIKAADLKVVLAPSLETLGLQKIEQNRKQIRLEGVSALAALLKEHL